MKPLKHPIMSRLLEGYQGWWIPLKPMSQVLLKNFKTKKVVVGRVLDEFEGSILLAHRQWLLPRNQWFRSDEWQVLPVLNVKLQ